jgi:dTDP-4-dehydrorhamnose 3,5-epimerase
MNAGSDVAPSDLPGVRWGTIARHRDARGSFRELWRASGSVDLDPRWTGADGAQFVQANLSTSAVGVLRGLHYHRRQLDRWIVASGRALVALVDVRPAVAGIGPAVVETRELVGDGTVTIPTGVAHGFLALEALELIYLVTNEYDGSDELGFGWDDPAVKVPWPACPTADGRPILSERDQANPTLADLLERLRPSGGAPTPRNPLP